MIRIFILLCTAIGFSSCSVLDDEGTICLNKVSARYQCLEAVSGYGEISEPGKDKIDYLRIAFRSCEPGLAYDSLNNDSLYLFAAFLYDHCKDKEKYNQVRIICSKDLNDTKKHVFIFSISAGKLKFEERATSE
jgi:hypothetical protein